MKEYRGRWDKISVGISLLCLFHCLALPLLFTSLSLAGLGWLENPAIEVVTLLLAMMAGGIAIGSGLKKHGNRKILVLFLAGMVFMILSNWFHALLPEAILKISGATLVISSHIMNYKQSRCRLVKS